MSISSLGGPQLFECWSLREDASVHFGPGPNAPMRVTAAGVRLTVDHPSGPLREAVRRMQLGPVSLRNVVPDFPDHDTPPHHAGTLARRLREELEELAIVTVRTLATGGAPALSLVPVAPGASLTPRPLEEESAVLLPPSAVVVPAADPARLCVPRASYRAEFHGRHARSLLCALAGAGPERPAVPVRPGPAAGTTLPAVLAYLVAAGLAERVPQRAVKGPATPQNPRVPWPTPTVGARGQGLDVQGEL